MCSFYRWPIFERVTLFFHPDLNSFPNSITKLLNALQNTLSFSPIPSFAKKHCHFPLVPKKNSGVSELVGSEARAPSLYVGFIT